MTYHSKKEHVDIVIVYVLSVVFIIVSTILHIPILPKSIKDSPEKKSSVNQAVPTPLFNKNTFNTITIEGKAYIVYDILAQDIIASHNENKILPLASITKVMTAVSATLHKPKDTKVTVNKDSIEDSYDLGLKNNQVWSLDELLKYTLIFSSNDGAEIIADSFGSKSIFVTQMNSDAKNLGLNLVFTDPAGRDVDGNIGGKGTVLEVAKLFGIARKMIPDILDATTKKRQTVVASNGKVSGIPNTNQHIEDLSGAEASKTGYTDLAGGNLGVVVDVSIGRPIVIVVLGSTKEGRFRDMSLLYTALRKSLSNK